MPTTFNVLSLGNHASIDTVEGNTTAENASALVGLTFGDVSNPLWELSQSFAPAGAGAGGGNAGVFDMNNSATNDQFSLDGGAAQTFDGTSIYNATITYTDGTTSTITAVIFQDTAGNTYLAPEFSANADQTDLQSGAIRSLTLDSLFGNNYSGMTANRQTTNFMVCFVQGTLIRTPAGDVPVETLTSGDVVCTLDNGPQKIRWIGHRMVPSTGAMQPIQINKGALGQNLPTQTLRVSRQHMMMTSARVVEHMFGADYALVAAHKLTELDGIQSCDDLGFVTYWHFMCDQHEIVFANDAPAETLYLGAQARKSMSSTALAEIQQIFPDLNPFSRHIRPSGKDQKQLVQRLGKNDKSVLARHLC